ncbi:MAG: ComEC/Rec2 family competence protein [Pseudomonadota bacterium]
MRSAIIGFVLGVVCLQQQASLLQWEYLGLLLLAACLCFFAGLRYPRSYIRLVLRFAGAGIAGFIWASAFAHAYLSQELPAEWEGQDVTVVGTIDSLPHQFPQGVRFNFSVEQALAQGRKLPVLPSKVSLSWYSSFGSQELGPIGDVRPGERWQLTVRLKRPHGNANEFGFDYEAWLLEQNLRATGTVRSDANATLKNQRLANFVWSFGNVVELSRAWLRQRINTALPDKPYAGVLVALVVGDQREVSQWLPTIKTCDAEFRKSLILMAVVISAIYALTLKSVLHGSIASCRFTIKICCDGFCYCTSPYRKADNGKESVRSSS